MRLIFDWLIIALGLKPKGRYTVSKCGKLKIDNETRLLMPRCTTINRSEDGKHEKKPQAGVKYE